MTVIDFTEALGESRRTIRENVRMFKRMRGMTNGQLAAATGLTEPQVQARTMANLENKNATYWDAAELEFAASAMRIPVHLFFMQTEDAWDAAMRLGLVLPQFGCMAA